MGTVRVGMSGGIRVLGAAPRLLLAACAPLLLAAPGLARAAGIDWSAVPGQQVVLFQPGQSSWEWNLTESDHSGGPKIRKGKRCFACHEGEEAKMGALIASGKKLEPDPDGRPGSIPIELKAAHDSERMYFRISWPKPAQPVDKTLVTVMIDDGSVKGTGVAGCWVACHDDARAMASAAPDSKLTKYLASTRTKITRSGGDENYKSADEIAKLRANKEFLELWQAVLESGSAKPVDEVVLEKRVENESPAVQVTASVEGDQQVVVLSRPLAGSAAHKAIAPGKTYTIGIALHQGTEHRFHNVSFERTLVLDSGDADVVAVKQ